MSENKTRPIQRRQSQVYIDVPLSIHPRPSSSSEQSLKENTPLRPSRTNSQSHMATLGDDGKLSKKRKATEDDLHDSQEASLSAKAKKSKAASAPQTSEKRKLASTKEQKSTTLTPADIPSEEYPHGYFYCHQCNRKRDRSEGLHCTFKNPKSRAHDDRCRLRYCRACLTNRYHQDMNVIMSRDPAELSKKQKENHILTDGYYFQCPKCQDDCNCRVCRKAKGLEPTGNLNLKARQAEKAAAEANAKGAAEAGSSTVPKTRKPVAKKTEKTLKAPKAESAKRAEAHKSVPKVKASKLVTKPPKPLPRPVWTRVATDLLHDDAVSRLHIREFCLRFALPLQLAQSHLDELEEPSGDNLGPSGGWDLDTDPDCDVVAWVSELCVKSIVQGLLDLIVDAAETREDHKARAKVKDAVKAVKASGANLNRVWGALASLRESVDCAWLSFADPTPPPASTTVRTTRSGLQSKDGQNIHIVSSAQLIPVIADLIDIALHAPSIRDSFETGPVEEKELAKSAKEAIGNENTRWKNLTGTKDKARRQQHNKLLRDVELSLRVAVTRRIPRFSPLGRDTEGRVYYVFSPGVGESDAAVKLIEGKFIKPKIGRKRVFSEDDRREMQRWSWFVAVWGKKPEGAEEIKNTNDQEDGDEEDDEEDGDEEEETWWGFWQPTEITKLAEWLEVKSSVQESSVGKPVVNGKSRHGKAQGSSSSSKLSSVSTSRAVSPLSALSDEEDEQTHVDNEGRQIPVTRELSELVSGLRNYAELLEWRIQRVSDEIAVEKPEKMARNVGPVPAAKFYG